MPGSDAGWPLPAIFRWRLARLSGDDLSTARKRQDLELGEVQLAAKRLELAQQRSELLERDDVERVFATALIEARESLMALVDLLATSSPPEMRNFVMEETDRHVRSVLKSLQRRLESDELDRQTTTGAADGADDEPQTEGTNHAES